MSIPTGNYSRRVNYTVTNTYGCGPDDEDDVYTIEEFRIRCGHHMFIDSDGFGYPVRNSFADVSIMIKSSALDEIPKDATHIVWFNK